MNSELLAACLDSSVPFSLQHLRVKDVVDREGGWKLEDLNALLPERMVHLVRSIPVPFSIQILDEVFWGLSPSGLFTVKSAFELLQEDSAIGVLDIQKWGWISRLFCSEKIKIFVWIILHDCLLTNSFRFRRHWSTTADCPRCPGLEETTMHVLRDCSFAREEWAKSRRDAVFFGVMEQQQWLQTYGVLQHGALDALERGATFLSTVWHIWKARNAFIFFCSSNYASRRQHTADAPWKHWRVILWCIGRK